MELKNFGYSLKNIPLPNKKAYTKLMIEKTQSFLKRLHGKAFFLTIHLKTVEIRNRILGSSQRSVHPRIRKFYTLKMTCMK